MRPLTTQLPRIRSGKQPKEVKAPANAPPQLKRLRFTDQDYGEILAGDQEAELHGPLIEEALRLQRKFTSFDPQNPMRPLRLLPIGVKEKDSSEFKQFRRASLTNDYPIQFVSKHKQITGE